MRRQISTLIPRKANICIFCALRNPGEITSPNFARSTRRAYQTSSTKCAGSSAASARQYDEDDGDDGFSMLKNSAAKSVPPLKTTSTQPLKVDLPKSPAFQISKHAASDRRPPLSDSQGGFRQRGRYGDTPERQRNSRPPPSNHPGDSIRPDFRASNFREQNAGFEEQRNLRNRGPKEGSAYASGSRRLNLDFTQRDAQPEPRQEEPRFRIDRFSGARSRTEVTQNVKTITPPPREHAKGRTLKAGQKQEPEETVEAYKPLYTFQPTSKSEPSAPIIQEESRAPRLAEETSRDAAPIELPSSSTPRMRFSSRFGADEQEEMKKPNYGNSTSRGRTPDFDFELYEAEQALLGRQKKKKKQKRQKIEAVKPVINIPEFMTVQQLAQALKIKQDDLLTKLEEEGFEGARYDHMLDAETSAMFADIYGFDPVALEEDMQDLVSHPPPEDVSLLPARPPIVTIMGHVDHGKTTILDWLRKSSVAAGEHGGITQHIGAFSVIMPGTEKRITFLDTPGHEAFLDMRRRGANVTDIVVLVVAADDSVKPQTIEAIKHALEARVQIIVAINKVDKHDANVDQVKQDLTRHEIVVEDYGGDYQAIPVSGKTGQGMEQLEEAIITLADVLDLRAEQDIPAEGQIIESKVTNAGRVATILVRRGILRVGDFIVAGPTWGRVRTLRNDAGQLVQAAYPGDPVQVDGWRGSDPTAGLEVLQAENEQQAKDVVDFRLEKIRSAQSLTDVAGLNATKAQEAEARAKVLAWEQENAINPRRRRDNEGWVDAEGSSGPKEIFFVVKADVAGSVEAIVAAVSAIGNNEIRASVVHSGTGPVTESDIQILAISGEGSYAISFNQSIEPAMHALAEAAGVQILNHNIIYKVTDVVKEKLTDALPAIVTQRVLGEAEIGQVFEITAKKQKIKIAGCKVTNGTISRSNKVRVIRNGETVYTGTINSLKNVKKDVTEMRKGTECGIGFSDWTDAQPFDQIQCFEEKEEKRTLY